MAATEEISADTAVEAVLSKLNGILTLRGGTKTAPKAFHILLELNVATHRT